MAALMYFPVHIIFFCHCRPSIAADMLAARSVGLQGLRAGVRLSEVSKCLNDAFDGGVAAVYRTTTEEGAVSTGSGFAVFTKEEHARDACDLSPIVMPNSDSTLRIMKFPPASLPT